MNIRSISNRYAKALFMLAEEQGNTNDIKKDYQSLNQAVLENGNFLPFFESPLYTVDFKLETLDKILSGKNINKTFVQFLILLVKNRRSGLLPYVFEAFDRFDMEKNNIVPIEVSTVDALTDELKKDMESTLNRLLKGQTGRFNYTTDKSLIGGFKAQVGTYEIDMSLSNQLSTLKNYLLFKE